LGGGAERGTEEVRSNKLEMVADDGAEVACGGAAEGAGESKRLRMSLAVFFCSCEAGDVGEAVDVAVEPPKISASRSSLVLWPPGTATTGSEGADISSPSRSTWEEGIASQRR
jgi:hypothetical protein